MHHIPITGIADTFSGIPIATIQHIHNSCEQSCARLGWFGWTRWVCIMKVMEVFGAHASLVIFASCVRILGSQHIRHLLCTKRGSVWQSLIDVLGRVARLLLSPREVLFGLHSEMKPAKRCTTDLMSQATSPQVTMPAFLSVAVVSNNSSVCTSNLGGPLFHTM